MAEKADFYEILGVSKTASYDDIKSKYRKLALVYHPDKNGSSGNKRFKEISEAYETLSDPNRRKSYDKSERREEQKKSNKESVKQTWLRQLKAIARELFRLIQNYSKSFNEDQRSVNHSHHRNSRRRIFDYGDELDKNFDRLAEGLNKSVGVDHDFSKLIGRKPNRKRKQKNDEDPWVKDWNYDQDLLNETFGLEKSKKRRKRQNYDYGFNMEDVFDL